MLCAALGACADLGRKDASSPFYPVPAGSKVVLHRDLEVPPDAARVYLQDGQVVKAPSIFNPFCRFDVNDVQPVTQVVRAGEFTVRKTQMDMLHISMAEPMRFAAIGFDAGGTSDITLVWYLWLDSPQPNVRRLLCGGRFDSPDRARRPSISEIRAQLGQVATLTIAGE